MIGDVPWNALIGGMLLGLSAALLLIVNGRVAGISGILAGLLKPVKGGFSWRVLFVTGMISAGFITPMMGFALPESLPVTSSLWLVVAGLLVGMGTKLANGCTSGHGICGMSRLSKRSFVATCTFMVTAIITVFIRLHG